MRFSWTTEDHVPDDPLEAFAALLPRLPEHVTLQWLRQAGGGPLHEGHLESEKLGYNLPVLGPMSRGPTGDWARWWCILWPREPHPDHGRLLVCFAEQDATSPPVQVIRLQDPCVLPPRNSREPYFALRLEAAQVKDYNPERADELRASPGVGALTGTSGPLLERRKKWILGLKDQREMEAWVKHIPLHLPYLRKERMGWESENFARQRSSPTPALPAQVTPAGEDDDSKLLQQVPSITGKLGDPADWEKLSSGGYGTVYRAYWMGAPVAVKVRNQAKKATPPRYIEAWDPEKLRNVCEIVRQAGDSLVPKLREHGINGLQVPGVVAYCRAITARSTHRQDFEKEVQTIYSVQHPFVVQCFGVYSGVSPLSHREEVMLVMDVADRGSLWAFLRQPRSNGTTGPSLSTRASIAQGIASGIAFLHGGERPLVHLDLKSLNILISGDNRPKICDFGAAQPESDVADSSFTPGTCAWMAPEVALTATLKMPADIYSFGVILWELLTKGDVISSWLAASEGKPAAGGANIPFWANEGLRPSIPPEYITCRGWVLLIEDCWRTDAAERPTIAAVVQQRCAVLERSTPASSAGCSSSSVRTDHQPEPEPREAETQTLAQRGERSRTALHVPEPSPLARALDDSITEVEAWLASLGLAQYAQAAAESAEFCDIEDYENLLEDEERWGECLAELGMTDVGDDAHRRLREGIAALNNTRLG
jgi:serine/threonine protein kinase